MAGRKKEIWREKNDEQENNVSLKEQKRNISVHGEKRKKNQNQMEYGNQVNINQSKNSKVK